MNEFDARTHSGALSQRKLIEEHIRKCDVLIDKLYRTIELFTLEGSSSYAPTIHADAAKELVYYTSKRVELVESLQLLIAGNKSPLTQIKLIGGIYFNEIAPVTNPNLKQEEQIVPESNSSDNLPEDTVVEELPGVENSEEVNDLQESFVDPEPKHIINDMPQSSDLLANAVTPLLIEIVQLKQELTRLNQQTELAMQKATQAETDADQAVSHRYKLTFVIALLLVGFSIWQYVASREMQSKQEQLQVVVQKLTDTVASLQNNLHRPPISRHAIVPPSLTAPPLKTATRIKAGPSRINAKK